MLLQRRQALRPAEAAPQQPRRRQRAPSPPRAAPPQALQPLPPAPQPLPAIVQPPPLPLPRRLRPAAAAAAAAGPACGRRRRPAGVGRGCHAAAAGLPGPGTRPRCCLPVRPQPPRLGGTCSRNSMRRLRETACPTAALTCSMLDVSTSSRPAETPTPASILAGELSSGWS